MAVCKASPFQAARLDSERLRQSIKLITDEISELAAVDEPDIETFMNIERLLRIGKALRCLVNTKPKQLSDEERLAARGELGELHDLGPVDPRVELRGFVDPMDTEGQEEAYYDRVERFRVGNPVTNGAVMNFGPESDLTRIGREDAAMRMSANAAHLAQAQELKTLYEILRENNELAPTVRASIEARISGLLPVTPTIDEPVRDSQREAV